MDYFQQLPNLIERYATLTAMRDHHAAAGRRLPAQQLQEIAAIEARAQSALDPSQLQAVQVNVNHMKQRVMGRMAASEQADQVIQQAAMKDDAYKSMTKGWLGQEEGLTKLQFEALEKGLPVPIKGNGLKYDAKQMDTQIQANTAGLTKNGKGMGYDQARGLANDLIEIRDNRGPDRYKAHLQSKYGKKAGEFAQFVDEWENSSLTEKRYIADKTIEAGRYDGDHVVTATEDDLRKATILRAWAGTNDSDQQDQSMMQDIDPAYYNKTSQGDVARAFDKHATEEGDANDRNYRPETYDESELIGSWNEQQENEDANFG